MDRRRVALLYRQIAALCAELAVEFEAEASAPVAKPAKRRKALRHVPAPVAVSDLGAQRAGKALRRLGIV